MADSMSFKFSGDIVEALDKLGAAAGESTLRAGGFAGAKLIRDEAQRNAPVISGVLKANIIVKRREEDSIGNTRQVYIVTIRKGKMNEEGDAYYGNWVESGHNIVRRKPKKTTWKSHRIAEAAEWGTSRVPARPFMRPAWESLKGSVTEVMRLHIEEKLKEQMGGAI